MTGKLVIFNIFIMTKTLQELQTSFDRSDTVGAVALGVLFLIMVVMILYLTRYGQTIAEH